MNMFHLESVGSVRHLRLSGDVTIEHAARLHAALVAAMAPGCVLAIDATAVARLDAAAVQVLIAAARAAASADVAGGSPAWTQALIRLGFDAALFSHPAQS